MFGANIFQGGLTYFSQLHPGLCFIIMVNLATMFERQKTIKSSIIFCTIPSRSGSMDQLDAIHMCQALDIYSMTLT